MRRLWRWLIVADAPIQKATRPTGRYVRMDLDVPSMECNGLTIEQSNRVVELYLELSEQKP